MPTGPSTVSGINTIDPQDFVRLDPSGAPLAPTPKGTTAAGSTAGATKPGAARSIAGQVPAPTHTLGKDDFLKLLLAQLRNQDPLKPMEDKEFIAQLAQFNSLEQIIDVNRRLGDLLASQQLSQASALVGKRVEVRTPEGIGEAGTNKLEGLVASVLMIQGAPKLVIGSLAVPLSAVTRVTDPASATGVGAGIGSGGGTAI